LVSLFLVLLFWVAPQNHETMQTVNAMLEEVIVVHDFNGGRVACSTLRPDGASSVAFWHDGGCYAEKAGCASGWCNTKKPGNFNFKPENIMVH